MKKLILILITLTTLTNVSYASYPVTESLQTEIIENATILNTPESSLYMILGFIVVGYIIFKFLKGLNDCQGCLA